MLHGICLMGLTKAERANQFNETQTPWIQTRLLSILCGMARVALEPHRKLGLRQLFARNVRLLRIHQGMSQEALAVEAGLDRTFVSSLERGVRNISIDNVEVLCAALKTPAHELLSPDFTRRHHLDESVVRAPRNARPYPAGT